MPFTRRLAGDLETGSQTAAPMASQVVEMRV
jgi:hypothetical protein